MKAQRIIQWDPHNPTHFMVGATDLRLYQFKKNARNTSAEPSFCLSVPLDESKDRGEGNKLVLSLIAVGLPNGRVQLVNFSTPTNRITKEFVPKHSRTCNSLAWNPVYNNQLAAGLDKVRGDFSTLVWDINAVGSVASPADSYEVQSTEIGFNISGAEVAESVSKPYAELANSEATISLAWVPNSPSCLVTGTGVKWLRIYDLRADVNTPQSVVAHSKSVHGVCFDPFHPERLATFSEDGIIKLWDIRNFTDPTFSFNTNTKGLSQIEWCPSRSGILASVSKEERCIKFWDIKDTIICQKNEKNEPVAPKPYKTHEAAEPLSSISWHPTNQHRMLTVTHSGLVATVSLQETIPLAWSPHGHVSFGYGKYLVESYLPASVDSHQANVQISDISFDMKQRALAGYSMDIATNKKIVDATDDTQLKTFWGWMNNFSSGAYGGKEGAAPQIELFQGIQSILKSTTGGTKKVDEKGNWFPVYLSAQRAICSQICGWGFEKREALEQALVKLESEGQYEKAAAIAVFHMDLKRAITSLTKASVVQKSGQNLKLVAMALAGCNEQVKGSLWREICLDPAVLKEIQHPYLRACFAFLCNESKDFKSVLEESDISIFDKVAFACRFLDDTDLIAFTEHVIKSLTKKGSLEGIVLTGLDSRGIDIFEKYVNITGDVQTAALALSNVVPRKFKDVRADQWVTMYRELLDTWQLWHQRAKFDITRKDTTPTPQVYARCNFCAQPLNMSMIVPRRGRGTRTTAAAKPNTVSMNSKQTLQKQKMNSCPNCKKSLPHCALCLLAFNCSVPNFVKSQAAQPTPFDEWFTWCQTCRHGGHAVHMLEWFKHHSKCPVSDCNCRCSVI